MIVYVDIEYVCIIYNIYTYNIHIEMVQWEQVIKIICNDPNWPSHRMILYQSCLRMLMILLSNWPTYPSPGGDQWRYTTEGTSNLKQATALNHGTSTASEDIWSITASLTSHSHHIHIAFTKFLRCTSRCTSLIQQGPACCKPSLTEVAHDCGVSCGVGQFGTRRGFSG